MRFRPRVLVTTLLTVVLAALPAACALPKVSRTTTPPRMRCGSYSSRGGPDRRERDRVTGAEQARLPRTRPRTVRTTGRAGPRERSGRRLSRQLVAESRPVYQQYLREGRIEVASTMVTGAQYAPVVPDYVVREHGVRSLADLAEKAHLFDHEILGIEPGTPGNQYILDAIRDDSYGLGGWRLVQSSTAAMLSEVERRTSERKPVVFLGWSPHWMNVEWNLHYLDDPQGIWPGSGEIRVVFDENFAEKNPDIAKFLSQIRIDRDTASDWIHRLSKEKVPAKQIAHEWIRAHPDEVRTWLRRGADRGRRTRIRGHPLKHPPTRATPRPS